MPLVLVLPELAAYEKTADAVTVVSAARRLCQECLSRVAVRL